MRFANLIHNGLNRDVENRIINLGDAFEIIAIDQIYERMGVAESEIKYIDLYDLESYRGEKLILPVNFMLAPNIMGVNLLNISPDIILVYLGVTFTQSDITESQKNFLQKWQPIGCRDEYTKDYLARMGVDAYIGGCLVTTIDSKVADKSERMKVIFIDVPKGVEKYIPESIKNDIVFMKHEYWVSYEQVCMDPSYKLRAQSQIDYYDKNAKLIVTSRFHGAVIALALGIPVILVAENNFYKFSWLSKLLPFYEDGSFAEIDWEPKPVDVEPLKCVMVEMAIKRLSDTYSIYEMANHLNTMLENPFRSKNKSLRYANAAVQYILSNWNIDDQFEYGIWGINDNAEYIYQYIRENYKKAKLVKVYDGLRSVTFHDIVSERPTEENISKSCFLFVASNTANKMAKELFDKIGKENYFLCKLEFIVPE